MSRNATALRALACQCRELATGVGMEESALSLNHMANDYDRQAERADKAEARTRDLLAGPRRA